MSGGLDAPPTNASGEGIANSTGETARGPNAPSDTNAKSTRCASHIEGYNFAYLDEQTKRMIRRAILKAVAIPGYQVPFASRDMPLPYGWGTGGIQVTAACIGPDDVLKVIDQGSDDTTNAISIRHFFQRTTNVQVTERTADATIIQTRHRIPETALREGQIFVYQVPTPEPLRWLEPRETESRKMHALADYGVMHVKLYEDIARLDRVGGRVAPPVRPHHRAYGSVHGGSKDPLPDRNLLE